MDRQRYIEEGYCQLNDTSVYLRTRASTISDIEEDIQHLADQLHIEGVITDDIRQFAIRRNTNPARLYLLPNDLGAEVRMHSFTVNCDTFSNEEKVAAVVPVTSVEVTCSEAKLALNFSALFVKCLMKILGRSALG